MKPNFALTLCFGFCLGMLRPARASSMGQVAAQREALQAQQQANGRQQTLLNTLVAVQDALRALVAGTQLQDLRSDVATLSAKHRRWLEATTAHLAEVGFMTSPLQTTQALAAAQRGLTAFLDGMPARAPLDALGQRTGQALETQIAHVQRLRGQVQFMRELDQDAPQSAELQARLPAYAAQLSNMARWLGEARLLLDNQRAARHELLRTVPQACRTWLQAALARHTATQLGDLSIYDRWRQTDGLHYAASQAQMDAGAAHIRKLWNVGLVPRMALQAALSHAIQLEVLAAAALAADVSPSMARQLASSWLGAQQANAETIQRIRAALAQDEATFVVVRKDLVEQMQAGPVVQSTSLCRTLATEMQGLTALPRETAFMQLVELCAGS